MAKQKHLIRYFFFSFSIPEKFHVKELFSGFVFVCHAFHLVLCSLFRLPGRSIAPICNQFQVLCVAVSVPGSSLVSSHFQVSRFQAKTSFSVPCDWESRVLIFCFRPLQSLQQSHPPVPHRQTYRPPPSSQPCLPPPLLSSWPQASQPSCRPSSASSPCAASSPS